MHESRSSYVYLFAFLKLNILIQPLVPRVFYSGQSDFLL